MKQINRAEIRKIVVEALEKPGASAMSMGIRGNDYEDYEIGEIVDEVSYYWDHTCDRSSKYTDDPFEMDGLCATGVFSFANFHMHDWEIEEIVDEVFEKLEFHKKKYYYDYVHLIIGKQTNDIGDDEHEIVLERPTVLYKF